MTGLSPAQRTLDGGSDKTRAETIAHLRRRMAAVPSLVDRSRDSAPVVTPQPAPAPISDPAPAPARTTVPRNRPAGSGRSDARDLLVALPGLAEVLPAGGVTRGSVTALTGSRSLLIGLLARVTAEGGYAAVVGHRGLGLLAAVEMGADLGRIALVPDPGDDRIGVAAVLLDGMDLVVLDLDGARVPPSRSRAVVARARSKGTALVVTGGEWEGAEVRVDAQVNGYEGLGQGHGRVQGMGLTVRAHGRAFPARGTRLVLRHQHGLMGWEADAEPVRAARAEEGRRGA
ncbi:hypothetical protein [Tomitella cavernea]|uniref:Uncharacterized protein n=1 Tax=Tomitella cavernea TaxID=1387982 RepID=A0ABP9CCH9_9ACTN|nr:hypothetical protein [Tomitella cavernea]